MAHVATITIDHTKVPGDLTDYVGLIVPDGSAGYSALYALCLEGGGDIRLFKSDDSTELAREVVSFSVSAETGELHYRYTGTLSSSVDTDIHVYADGSSSDYAVGATYGRNAVWSDYDAVWHLKEGSGNTRLDSTGNNDLTDNQTVPNVAAQIGDGAELNGSSEYLEISDAAQTGLEGQSNLTVDFWLKSDSLSSDIYWLSKDQRGTSNRSFIVGAFTVSGSQNFAFAAYTSGSGIFSQSTAHNMTTGTSYKLNYVWNGTTGNIEFFKDGVSQGSETNRTGSIDNTPSPVYLGAGAGFGGERFHDGMLDEMRMHSGVRSTNWITTEYNNQNSPSTFYSVAAVAGGSAAQAARRGVIMMM